MPPGPLPLICAPAGFYREGPLVSPPLFPTPLGDLPRSAREAAGCGHRPLGGWGRAAEVGPREPRPTHASHARTRSRANSTGARSAGPLLILFTRIPERAHVLTHPPTHRLTGAHAHVHTHAVHTHPPSHTRPHSPRRVFTHSCITQSCLQPPLKFSHTHPPQLYTHHTRACY